MIEIYNIYSNIYYDNELETYIPILCINKYPNGNLKYYIKKINNTKISSFNLNNDTNKCIFAIKSFKNCNELLNPDNINELIEFILNNNYTIEYNITDMINNSINKNINNKNLLMFIKYIL